MHDFCHLCCMPYVKKQRAIKCVAAVFNAFKHCHKIYQRHERSISKSVFEKLPFQKLFLNRIQDTNQWLAKIELEKPSAKTTYNLPSHPEKTMRVVSENPMDPMDPMDCLWKPGTFLGPPHRIAPETRLPFPQGTRRLDTARRDQHSYSCLGALHVICSLDFVQKRETTLIPS